MNSHDVAIIIGAQIREEELSKLISFCCISHLDMVFYLMDLCAVGLGSEKGPVCCGEAVSRAERWGLLLNISFWKQIVFLAPAAALLRDWGIDLILEISPCDCCVS